VKAARGGVGESWNGGEVGQREAKRWTGQHVESSGGARGAGAQRLVGDTLVVLQGRQTGG